MASFPGQRAGAPPTGPTTPSSLNAVMSGLNVQLTWSPSSDGDVPISYIIYRCAGVSCNVFSQLAVTPTGASSFSDSTAASFTTYSYRIQATDGGGNLSGFSNISTLTTPDTTAPIVPVLSFTNNNNAVQLSWTTSTDPDDAVVQYNVSRSANNGPFTVLTSVLAPTTNYTDSTIQAGSGYQYYVTAQDSHGNISGISNVVSIAASDVTPPTVPTGLAGTPVSSSKINLSWNASTDTGSGVKNYTVFRNSVAIGTVTLTSFSDTGLANFTSYTYTVLATDNANNSSAQSSPITVQTLDQIAPTVPGSFTAVAVSSSEIDLSWTASTDQGSGVNFYTVIRNPGAFSVQVQTLTYKDVGLTASTLYTYTVSATDNSGNTSATTATSATTQSGQTLSFAPPYPKLVFNAIGTTTDDYYHNVTVTVQRLGSLPILQAYGMYNIFILGADNETWSTNATPNRDRQVLVTNMKSASTAPLGTKVLIYGDGQQYAVSGSAYPTWVSGITANPNWILYNNATLPQASRVPTQAPDGAGINLVNYAENSSGTAFAGKNSFGETPFQYTAHYQFYAHLSKNRTGADASRFAAVPTGQSATNLDGIQFDNMWVDPRVNGDWQMNGTQSTKDNGAYQNIWSDQLAKGQRDFYDTLSNLITAAGQTQWLCGNAGDYAHTELGNTLTTAGVMNGVLNSSYFESAIGKFYSVETQQNFAIMLADVNQLYDFLKDPHVAMLNMAVPDGTSAQSGNLPFNTTKTAVNGEYQWARYMTTAALLTDCYFSIQRQSSGYNANGTDLTWYDEFDNAGAALGWLGSPVDTRQTAIRTWYDGSTIPNVYAREYQNGLAICVAKTGSGAAAQPTGTVTISGAQLGIGAGRFWNFITGTQATAVNPGGAVQSTGVTLQASRDGIVLVKSGVTGPTLPLLKASTTNPRWLADSTGKAVLLSGSHSWNSFQDTDTSVAPATIGAMSFANYVSFLVSHGHNATILWKKDLPTYFNWGAGGTWRMAPHPWSRVGPGNATDGLLKFDLNTLYQPYFDRLRARVITLNQNGIYAIVELFDGLGINYNRGSADGYPFTGANNINGIDDGYTSGTSGTASMTMSSTNSITAIQVTYIKKVIDTLNDLPNVIWEVSEEAPDNSTFWHSYMIGQIKTYEGTKPFQHPVLFPTLDVSGASDSTIYNSNADVVAPKIKISPANATGTGTPATKVSINDSDHTYFSMWNDSTQTNRNSWAWPNFCQGNGVLFMDPYLINWTNRNAPGNVTNGVGTTPDTRWNNLRDNMGRMAHYSSVANISAMSPNGALSSTGYCLANPGTEYIAYCPNAASSGFTVDLSASSSNFSLEWFDCNTLAVTNGGTVSGGAVRTLIGTSSLDMVAYLKASSSSPLSLPLANSSTPLFTFVGSFLLDSNFNYGGQGIAVGGSTASDTGYLYATGIQAQKNAFLGKVKIPTLATISAGGQTATTVVAPVSIPGNFGTVSSGNPGPVVTGVLEYNGQVYVTCGLYYDTTNTALMTVGSTSLTGWTTPSPISPDNGDPQRMFADPLIQIPTVWRPYLTLPNGNPAPAAIASCAGGLSRYSAQCAGMGLTTFDPASVTSGASFAAKEYMQYPYQIGSTYTGLWGSSLNTQSNWPAPTGSPPTGNQADNYSCPYTGHHGTAIIPAGTRTLLYIHIHVFGPGRNPFSGANTCDTGSSEYWDATISPDTVPYRRVQCSAYDLAAIINNKNSSGAINAVKPYAFWEFPNWFNLVGACPGMYGQGIGKQWCAYDPQQKLFYAAMKGFGNAPQIWVWSVNAN